MEFKIVLVCFVKLTLLVRLQASHPWLQNKALYPHAGPFFFVDRYIQNLYN